MIFDESGIRLVPPKADLKITDLVETVILPVCQA